MMTVFEVVLELMTPIERRVYKQLVKKGGLEASKLVYGLHLTSATVYKALKRMERAGLIKVEGEKPRVFKPLSKEEFIWVFGEAVKKLAEEIYEAKLLQEASEPSTRRP